MERLGSDEDKTRVSRRKLLSACAIGILGSTTASASAKMAETASTTGSTITIPSGPVQQRTAAVAEEQPQSSSPPPATVTFSAQSSDGTTVVVDSVMIPEDGFVAIHNTRLQQGERIESVTGASEYLEPGHHENVKITLFDVPGATYDRTRLSTDQTLIAMPHEDTDTNRRYEFVESNGSEDPPFTTGNKPVTDSACVTTDNC